MSEGAEISGSFTVHPTAFRASSMRPRISPRALTRSDWASVPDHTLLGKLSTRTAPEQDGPAATPET